MKPTIPLYGVTFHDGIIEPVDSTITDIRDCVWIMMENICPVLKPLEEVIDILGKMIYQLEAQFIFSFTILSQKFCKLVRMIQS